MSNLKRRSRWYIVWYPVAIVAAIELFYQFVITSRQAGLIAEAHWEYLALAVANQLAVYVVLTPAMQEFYGKAKIRLSGWRTFSLIAMGLALARIVPGGEYIVWRSSLRQKLGGIGATTQWQIMYYIWMVGGLFLTFLVAEILTFTLYPNAHAKSLAGNLRFVPLVLTVVVLVLVLAVRRPAVQRLLHRLAFDQFGSKALSPFGIIRERQLGKGMLGLLTFASLSAWLIEGFTLFLCLKSLGIVIPFAIALFAFAFARVFTYLPIIPGGIGEAEASTVLVLAAYGYPAIPVFTATVLYRLITYWPPLLMGGLAYLIEKKKPQPLEQAA